MTEKFNRDYQQDHTVFGGNIDIQDFNTNHPYRKRISNQIETINTEKQRKDIKNYKDMTLEELREMRVISNTTGRPTSDLTDKKWQQEFEVRKLFITPYKSNVRKMKGEFSRESGKWNEETQGIYYGKTNWQEYCSFINDILKNIRSGQTDYCYFIYQILDLLKFHFDDLRTRYRDGYWEVWLENN